METNNCDRIDTLREVLNGPDGMSAAELVQFLEITVDDLLDVFPELFLDNYGELVDDV